MDMFNHNRPMMPNNCAGTLPTSGILGPNVPMRPLGPQVRFVLSGPELNNLVSLHNYQHFQEPDGPNWRRPSPPTPGVLSSPALGIRPHARSAFSAWDVLDVNQFQRESKRSRMDSPLSMEDPFFLVFSEKIKLLYS